MDILYRHLGVHPAAEQLVVVIVYGVQETKPVSIVITIIIIIMIIVIINHDQ